MHVCKKINRDKQINKSYHSTNPCNIMSLPSWNHTSEAFCSLLFVASQALVTSFFQLFPSPLKNSMISSFFFGTLLSSFFFFFSFLCFFLLWRGPSLFISQKASAFSFPKRPCLFYFPTKNHESSLPKKSHASLLLKKSHASSFPNFLFLFFLRKIIFLKHFWNKVYPDEIECWQ